MRTPYLESNRRLDHPLMNMQLHSRKTELINTARTAGHCPLILVTGHRAVQGEPSPWDFPKDGGKQINRDQL